MGCAPNKPNLKIIKNSSNSARGSCDTGNNSPVRINRGRSSPLASITSPHREDSSERIRDDTVLIIKRSKFIQEFRSDPNEKYETLQLLGEGSYGKVFKVCDKFSKVIRAMKVIKKYKKNFNPDEEAKILKEMNILKSLDHPNILKVYEFYNTEENFYIISELCQGGELFDKIIKSKQFDEGVAAHIMKQLLSAIQYCHQNNMVHRDLKPENILIETLEEKEKDYFNIKVIDFGTAEIFKNNTMLHKQIGTPYYIAPEVLKNQYNEKCDLWSCGVIMFILLCGCPPFYGKTDDDIYESVKTGKYSFKHKVWANVSDHAKNLIKSLLEQDISKRLSAEKALKHKWFSYISQNNKNPMEGETDIECVEHSKILQNSTQNLHNFKVLNEALENLRNFNSQKKIQQAALFYIVHNSTTVDDVKDLRKIFNKFDENNDGRLTMEELTKGFRNSVKNKFSDEDLQRIISRIDVDKNGFIEYEEFLTATIDCKKLLTEENLKKAFRLFDKDGSGKISSDELKMILTCDHENEEVWKKVISEIDCNGDGEISFEEFVKMMRNLVTVA
jgi:calcium-dependent protein kinase